MDFILLGLQQLADPLVFATMCIGAILGVVGGAIPGAGAAVTVSILLPTTFSMDPLNGMTLLLGVYCGAAYGAAIPAVMINTPGSPVAVLTALEAKPFVMRGEARDVAGLFLQLCRRRDGCAGLDVADPAAGECGQELRVPRICHAGNGGPCACHHRPSRLPGGGVGGACLRSVSGDRGGRDGFCHPALQFRVSAAVVRHTVGPDGDRPFCNVRGLGSADQSGPAHHASAAEGAFLSGLHGGLQISEGPVWIIAVRHSVRHHAGGGRVFGATGQLCGGQEILP